MVKDGEDRHGLQTTNLKTVQCANRDEAPLRYANHRKAQVHKLEGSLKLTDHVLIYF